MPKAHCAHAQSKPQYSYVLGDGQILLQIFVVANFESEEKANEHKNDNQIFGKAEKVPVEQNHFLQQQEQHNESERDVLKVVGEDFLVNLDGVVVVVNLQISVHPIEAKADQTENSLGNEIGARVLVGLPNKRRDSSAILRNSFEEVHRLLGKFIVEEWYQQHDYFKAQEAD